VSDGRSNVFARGEEFLRLFKRGAEFTQELLTENERLRRLLMEFEARQESAARSPHDWNKLRTELVGRIQSLEEEYRTVRERLQDVEEENRHFADRYVEIEEENNALANLYVASYQLHSTLDIAETLKIVIEIVINLIGAEVFALYLLDESTRRLEAVAAEGLELSAFPVCSLGSGRLGAAVALGETKCWDSTSGDDLAQPLVCIPLVVQERSIGAIAIHRLLQQKDGFSSLDHELFTMLGGHAATAIVASRLYSQSERKLNTIQGLIDLLAR
jgi:nitrate/nitrite-specific signal transduction histidine kinase